MCVCEASGERVEFEEVKGRGPRLVERKVRVWGLENES